MRIIHCTCLILLLSSISHAKEWHGIVPLHSTCEDVRRVFGKVNCETSFFKLNDESVFIIFSENPCDEKLPGGWNVPMGTVLSITVYPKKSPKLVDMHIDEKRYTKIVSQHLIGFVEYTNEEEGIKFTLLPDGSIESFTYGPSAKDNYLRCPALSIISSNTGEKPYTLRKFDEYNEIPFDKQKLHLERFALEMQEAFGSSSSGHIIVYGGRRTRVGEVEMYAECAKNYLVNKLSIEPGRIVTVDGGYREKLTVELWIRPQGYAAPTPKPTVPLSEVKIISDNTKMHCVN